MRARLEYEELYVNGGVVSNVVMNRRVKLILRRWPVVFHAQFLQQLSAQPTHFIQMKWNESAVI